LILNDPTGRPAPSDTCDVELCTALKELIDGAHESIDFAIYGMRDQTAIYEALERAKARGVKVRGLVDRELDGTNIYSSTDELATMIGDLRSDLHADARLKRREDREDFDYEPPCPQPEGFPGPLQCLAYDLGDQCLFAAHAAREDFGDAGAIMHNKFFVVDRRHVWTGSTNISDSGTGGYNANLVTVVESPRVAAWYTTEFEQMWRYDKYHSLKERSPEMKTSVSNADLEVYFSPQDGPVDAAVRPILQAAEERIDIAVFFLTHKHIAGDLIKAHQRGVKVRIIIDATGASNGYTKHELLRLAGIAVKVENWGGKMHMKSAAVDGEVVITGSMNWTSAGTRNNDENTIIVRSPELARQYHAFYDEMWNQIPDRWLEGRPDPESKDSTTSCSDGSDNDFDELKDGDDPGCGDSPPPVPGLPPNDLVPKGDRAACEWRPDKSH